jgi:phosphatidylinositol alpha-1,6-mannosyltransferase
MIRLASDRHFPKVLLVTRNFPPLRGGMERLNARMFDILHTLNPECALVGPAGSGGFVPDGARVAELVSGALPATLVSSLTRGVSMARRVRPDAVLAGSGLAAPAAVAAALASGAVPMVYLHGLDIIAPSHLYQAAWLPCIRRCRRVLVNSRNTRRLAIQAGIDADRIRIAHPGTGIPPLDPAARARFRARHEIAQDAPMLLSVGRLTPRKGIAEFVERGLPAIHAVHPDVHLVIIGDEAPDALKRSPGGGIVRVRMAADDRGLGSAIRWLGPLDDRDLADAYQSADLHLFPGQEMPGDVEGFGMVAIEAAAHGLPTIAFDVGGVSDAVVDGANGRLLTAGDYEGFAQAVIAGLSGDEVQERERARSFSRSFSWESFGTELIDALVARE